MKPEIQKIWANRLIEGSQEQARCHLYADGGMCCLGVLSQCFIESEEGIAVNARWVRGATDDSYYLFVADNLELKDYEESYLPKPVAEWAGVNGNNVVIGKTRATELNDSHGYTLKQIGEKILSEGVK